MELNTEKEETAVFKSIIALMKKKPFLGYLIQQLTKTFIEPDNGDYPTLAVGKHPTDKTIKLWVNKGYISKLLADTMNGTEFVTSCLEHELLHVVMDHIFIDFQDHLRGNVAMDMSVNQYISKIPENWVTCQEYNLQTGESCYFYYDALKNNKKFQQDVKEGKFGNSGARSFIMKGHKMWKGLKLDKIGKEIVKELLNKSKQLSNRDYGSMHRDLIEHIDEQLARKAGVLPWQRILRMFTANAMESYLSQTIMRKSKRFGTRPGTRQQDVLNLACTIDTSGSISCEELEEFFREINSIHKNGVSVTVIEADDKVCDSYRFKGKFRGSVHGRGGTDLEPALDWVDKNDFDAHVYFTDFFAPAFTTRYKTPVLWVLTSNMDPSSYPCQSGIKVNLRNGKPI